VQPVLLEGDAGGVCSDNCPGDGTGKVDNGTEGSGVSFPVTGAKWAGNCSINAQNDPPSGCGLVKNTTSKMPTVEAFNSTYYKVTLASGCKLKDTGWSPLGGRYGVTDPGDRYVKEINFTCADSSTPSGDAWFVNNGTVGYIKKIYINDLTRRLRYIYLKFCC
jgi:hypothetical protein